MSCKTSSNVLTIRAGSPPLQAAVMATMPIRSLIQALRCLASAACSALAFIVDNWVSPDPTCSLLRDCTTPQSTRYEDYPPNGEIGRASCRERVCQYV